VFARLFDIRDKAVSLAGHGLDLVLLLAIVADGGTRRIDAAGQC